MDSLEDPTQHLGEEEQVQPSKAEHRVPDVVIAPEAVIAEDIGGTILFTVSLYFELSNISPQFQKWSREAPSPLSPKTKRWEKTVSKRSPKGS